MNDAEKKRMLGQIAKAKAKMLDCFSLLGGNEECTEIPNNFDLACVTDNLDDIKILLQDVYDEE
jgi:hypothetical protein